MSDTMEYTVSPELAARHQAAEEDAASYSYAKPEGVSTGKGWVRLGKCGSLRGVVQVVKKDGGENNLHYHTTIDSFWMVLKGRVRFYGAGDVLVGEFGPQEGTFTPAYSRYWFENVGEDELELLQVSSFQPGAADSGRTDASPQRYKVGSGEKFSAEKG